MLYEQMASTYWRWFLTLKAKKVSAGQRLDLVYAKTGRVRPAGLFGLIVVEVRLLA